MIIESLLNLAFNAFVFTLFMVALAEISLRIQKKDQLKIKRPLVNATTNDHKTK
jgi:hypothetical protein